MTAAIQRDLKLPPLPRWQKGQQPTRAQVHELERRVMLLTMEVERLRFLIGGRR